MHSRSGFTLVEMVVTLAVGAVLVLLTQRMYAGITDAAVRAAQARSATDRRANGRHLVSLLLASASIGSTRDLFDGTTTKLEFDTWWIEEHGWRVRRRCALQLDGSRLLLRGLDSVPLVLGDSIEAGMMEYLPERGEAVPWLRAFQSQLLLPVAVRLRVRRGERVDTLLFTTGERG